MLKIAHGIRTKLEPFEGSAKYSFVIRELLEKTNLTTGGSDRGFVVLAHLVVNEVRDQFPGGCQGRQVQMQIVDIEKDWPAAIERSRAGRFIALEVGGRPARGRKLRLFVDTTGSNLFEKLDRLGLAIDAKFEVLPSRPLTKRPCLSKTMTSVCTSSV